MERLSDFAADIVNDLYENSDWYGDRSLIEAAINRLAAYEDTGLEPEDFKRSFDEGALLKLTGQFLGVTPDCLRELAQADREGRCVVLPCEVGDTIWMIVTKRPKISMPEFSFIKRSRLSWLNIERVLIDFGKTVFLTREEAEAALEGDEE
jgi:hypothetical protein